MISEFCFFEFAKFDAPAAFTFSKKQNSKSIFFAVLCKIFLFVFFLVPPAPDSYCVDSSIAQVQVSARASNTGDSSLDSYLDSLDIQYTIVESFPLTGWIFHFYKLFLFNQKFINGFLKPF